MVGLCLCRPSGAAVMSPVRGPTAYAVGYFLAPLRGSSGPRAFRFALMGQRPGRAGGFPSRALKGENRCRFGFKVFYPEFEMPLADRPSKFRKENLNHRMRKSYAGLALLIAVACLSPDSLRADNATQQKTPPTAQEKPHTSSQSRTHKSSASSSQSSSAHRSSKHRPPSKAALAAAARRRRAQMRPGPERIQEIQQALVKTGYLKVEPNGLWDDPTRDAMRRYQADNGFPVTGLPEAKSLMKLGLGPHPLPPEVDTSNVAKADANGNSDAAPAAPNSSQSPPSTTTPQP